MEERSNDGDPTNTPTPKSLNDFPQDILLHILSFLPTIDAVQTSLISRKWRNLWSSVPSLYFSYDLFPPVGSPADTLRFYASSVDRTLIHRHHKSPLHSFRLEFDFKHYDYDYVITSWILYAINHNTLELDLDFFIDKKYHSGESERLYYDFPFFLLRNGRVRVLKLCHCDLTVPNTMSGAGFLSIRSMFLDQIFLTDQMVSDLLVGCGNLESLTLEHCYGMDDLKICSSRLKELRLRFFYCDEASVEIACPSLRLLVIIDFQAGKYSLKNSSALVEANVFYLHRMECYVYWSKVVRLLAHVKCLHAQNWWFKLLATKDVFPGGSVLKNLRYLELQTGYSTKDVFPGGSVLKNLRYLELQTGYSKSDLLGMVALFEICPNLDTMMVDYLYKIDEDESLPEECLNKPINFCLPTLRQVKIKDFRATENQLYFLELLKQQGAALKKIVLVPPRVDETFCPPIVLVKRPRGGKVLEGSSTQSEA